MRPGKPKNNFRGVQPGCVMKRGPIQPRQPGDTMAGPVVRPADFFQKPKIKPTAWMSREIRRRKQILAKFNALVAGGLSRTKAAKTLRQSLVTIWRYESRLFPNLRNCGQKPMLEKLLVPTSVISRVQRLQLAGKSNADAWRAVAGEKICPPALAKFLRTSRSIPHSFLKATRLQRETVKVITGKNFSLIQP